jgi:hypothetical protein
MIAELQKQLHGDDSPEDFNQIQARHKELKKKSSEINGKLGRIVIR